MIGKLKQFRMTTIALGLAGAMVCVTPVLRAHEGHEAAAQGSEAALLAHASEQMATAAHNFWASLTPEQQARAGFDFDNAERMNWHFIPKERKGLPWKDMTSAQRALGHAFLASGLSQRAYMQAQTIMSLDQVLKEMEPGPPKTPLRDPDNYYFSIFGTPGEKGTWGWRVEGHHLSLNFTIVDGKAAVGGPIFLGSNPAEVRQGPRKGLRVLAEEEDMGFALIKSLSPDQQKKAIINDKAPNEIITGADRKANPGEPAGVAAGGMNAEQKTQLMALIEFYANRLRPELADDDMKKIEKAGIDKIHFAWAGATAPGEAHYYRIHGPTFLVEFDNTQNNANHVHTVWRDAANDFGEDLLKKHYEDHPHDATNK
ncbi:MAG: hypothetical protein JWL69_4665 [Phycisphaerales bacterium]|nr:hypothetical protein [Phycisphaerales bacterium]MDB5357898.1 hypothetical protein [Phycisphaerales bacterium]